MLSSSKTSQPTAKSRRTLLILGVVVGLAIVAGVVVAGLAGLFGSVSEPSQARGTPGASVSVNQLMAPEALPDIMVAKTGTDDGKDAPVTIVEYASMTCPHCAAFHATTYPVLVSKYVDAGKARFVLREFPLDELATAAFMLARCSGPDKRNAMVDLLFQQQRNWAYSSKPEEALANLVKQTGMSRESFDACLRDQSLRQKIDEVRDRAAQKFGVNATPTFFINGVKHNGEITPEELDKLLEPFLKQ